MRLEPAIVVAIALVVRPAAALVAPAPTVDFDMSPPSYVSATDDYPPPAGVTAPVVTTRTQNPDGSVDLTVDAAKLSLVHFGPGFAQLFSGEAAAHGFGRAGNGAVRVFVRASASSLPLDYLAPSPGALGSNEYESWADMSILAVFWDVIVPPPTSGKTVGSPTSLYLEPHFDCTVDGDYSGVDPGVSFGAGTGLYTDPDTGIGTVAIDDSAGCSPQGVGRAVGGLTVGTPVLMRFAVDVKATAIAGNHPFSGDVVTGSQFALIDGLNTGYTIIKDADGNEVVGESGVHYGAKPVLPELTTTTTTTTTSTFVPPTTLAGCDPNAYCGDGTYQPECGEACDCPPLPGGATATVCAANVSLPTLGSACALCAGCQIDESPCVLTTTTVSTTTDTLPGSTTSTLPSGGVCAGVAGFAGVQCVCGEGLTPAACASDHVPPVVPRLFGKACGLVAHAATVPTPAKAKKAKKLVHGAIGHFGQALAKVEKAAKKSKLDGPCSAALSTTLGDMLQRAQKIADGF